MQQTIGRVFPSQLCEDDDELMSTCTSPWGLMQSYLNVWGSSQCLQVVIESMGLCPAKLGQVRIYVCIKAYVVEALAVPYKVDSLWYNKQ